MNNICKCGQDPCTCTNYRILRERTPEWIYFGRSPTNSTQLVSSKKSPKSLNAPRPWELTRNSDESYAPRILVREVPNRNKHPKQQFFREQKPKYIFDKIPSSYQQNNRPLTYDSPRRPFPYLEKQPNENRNLQSWIMVDQIEPNSTEYQNTYEPETLLKPELPSISNKKQDNFAQEGLQRWEYNRPKSPNRFNTEQSPRIPAVSQSTELKCTEVLPLNSDNNSLLTNNVEENIPQSTYQNKINRRNSFSSFSSNSQDNFNNTEQQNNTSRSYWETFKVQPKCITPNNMTNQEQLIYSLPQNTYYPNYLDKNPENTWKTIDPKYYHRNKTTTPAWKSFKPPGNYCELNDAPSARKPVEIKVNNKYSPNNFDIFQTNPYTTCDEKISNLDIEHKDARHDFKTTNEDELQQQYEIFYETDPYLKPSRKQQTTNQTKDSNINTDMSDIFKYYKSSKQKDRNNAGYKRQDYPHSAPYYAAASSNPRDRQSYEAHSIKPKEHSNYYNKYNNETFRSIPTETMNETSNSDWTNQNNFNSSPLYTSTPKYSQQQDEQKNSLYKTIPLHSHIPKLHQHDGNMYNTYPKRQKSQENDTYIPAPQENITYKTSPYYTNKKKQDNSSNTYKAGQFYSNKETQETCNVVRKQSLVNNKAPVYSCNKSQQEPQLNNMYNLGPSPNSKQSNQQDRQTIYNSGSAPKYQKPEDNNKCNTEFMNNNFNPKYMKIQDDKYTTIEPQMRNIPNKKYIPLNDTFYNDKPAQTSTPKCNKQQENMMYNSIPLQTMNQENQEDFNTTHNTSSWLNMKLYDFPPTHKFNAIKREPYKKHADNVNHLPPLNKTNYKPPNENYYHTVPAYSYDQQDDAPDSKWIEMNPDNIYYPTTNTNCSIKNHMTETYRPDTIELFKQNSPEFTESIDIYNGNRHHLRNQTCIDNKELIQYYQPPNATSRNISKQPKPKSYTQEMQFSLPRQECFSSSLTSISTVPHLEVSPSKVKANKNHPCKFLESLDSLRKVQYIDFSKSKRQTSKEHVSVGRKKQEISDTNDSTQRLTGKNSFTRLLNNLKLRPKIKAKKSKSYTACSINDDILTSLKSKSFTNIVPENVNIRVQKVIHIKKSQTIQTEDESKIKYPLYNRIQEINNSSNKKTKETSTKTSNEVIKENKEKTKDSKSHLKLLYRSVNYWHEHYMELLLTSYPRKSDETVLPKLLSDSSIPGYNKFIENKALSIPEPYIKNNLLQQNNIQVQTELSLGENLQSISITSTSAADETEKIIPTDKEKSTINVKNGLFWEDIELPPPGTMNIRSKSSYRRISFLDANQKNLKEEKKETKKKKKKSICCSSDGDEKDEPYSHLTYYAEPRHSETPYPQFRSSFVSEYYDTNIPEKISYVFKNKTDDNEHYTEPLKTYFDEQDISPCTSKTEIPWNMILLPVNPKIRKLEPINTSVINITSEPNVSHKLSFDTILNVKTNSKSCSSVFDDNKCRLEDMIDLKCPLALAKFIPTNKIESWDTYNNSILCKTKINLKICPAYKEKDFIFKTQITGKTEDPTLKMKTNIKCVKEVKDSNKNLSWVMKPMDTTCNTLQVLPEKNKKPLDKKCVCSGIKKDYSIERSKESLLSTLPLRSFKEDPVLQAFRACEAELKPVKQALVEVQTKLRKLNMPELDCIFKNSDLKFELNEKKINNKMLNKLSNSAGSAVPILNSNPAMYCNKLPQNDSKLFSNQYSSRNCNLKLPSYSHATRIPSSYYGMISPGNFNFPVSSEVYIPDSLHDLHNYDPELYDFIYTEGPAIPDRGSFSYYYPLPNYKNNSLLQMNEGNSKLLQSFLLSETSSGSFIKREGASEFSMPPQFSVRESHLNGLAPVYSCDIIENIPPCFSGNRIIPLYAEDIAIPRVSSQFSNCQYYNGQPLNTDDGSIITDSIIQSKMHPLSRRRIRIVRRAPSKRNKGIQKTGRGYRTLSRRFKKNKRTPCYTDSNYEFKHMIYSQSACSFYGYSSLNDYNNIDSTMQDSDYVRKMKYYRQGQI